MNEREIFIAARLKANAAEVAAFLDQACGDDESLRQRILTLLGEQDRLGGFLEAPAVACKTAAEQTGVEQPGTLIGSYRLLERIGEGGMGLVFVAEQLQPVRRKVALKLIKPGMDSKQVI